MQFDATFLISVISFIVFVFIMNKIFYQPVMNIIQERKSYIDNNYDLAKDIKKSTDEHIKRYDTKINETRKTARKIVSDATEDTKLVTAKILCDAKNKISEDLIFNKQELINSTLQVQDELKTTVKNFAKEISLKIVGDLIPTNYIDNADLEEYKK